MPKYSVRLQLIENSLHLLLLALFNVFLFVRFIALSMTLTPTGTLLVGLIYRQLIAKPLHASLFSGLSDRFQLVQAQFV